MPYQNTLNGPVRMSGIGIHSGVDCKVTLLPADPDTGRVFLQDGTVIPADISHVVDTSRCTTLGIGDARVRTVEHLMAALWAIGVDNATIQVEGPEIPILDGSALPFFEALQSVGVCSQGVEARVITISETLSVSSQDGFSSMSISPCAGFEIEVQTLFPNWPEGDGCHLVVFDDLPKVFARELACARTFAFAEEVERLRKAGLARGGSLDNVLIITPPNEFSSPLRKEGEWWRHKAIDVAGDLALVGARFLGRITARRPGHTINSMLARAIVERT